VNARESGQASVELVALLPLVAIVALTALSFLAARAAGEQAGQAAQAGAMALLQDSDARRAARRAVPGHLRPRTTVAVAGRRVTVRVRPSLPVPGLSTRLTATASADAGPEPAP